MKKLSVGILCLGLIGLSTWNLKRDEFKNLITKKTFNRQSSITEKKINFEAIKEMIGLKDPQAEDIKSERQAPMLKEDAFDSQSHADRINEIDRVLANANAIDRMNSGDLDEKTRNDYIALFELRQALLTELVDREVQASQEYLAGQK